jgi:hypothetical protein
MAQALLEVTKKPPSLYYQVDPRWFFSLSFIFQSKNLAVFDKTRVVTGTETYGDGIFPLTCFNVATMRKLTITNKSHELTFPR